MSEHIPPDEFQARLDRMSREQLEQAMWILKGFTPEGMALALKFTDESPRRLDDKAHQACPRHGGSGTEADCPECRAEARAARPRKSDGSGM